MSFGLEIELNGDELGDADDGWDDASADNDSIGLFLVANVVLVEGKPIWQGVAAAEFLWVAGFDEQDDLVANVFAFVVLAGEGDGMGRLTIGISAISRGIQGELCGIFFVGARCFCTRS